MVRIDLPYPLRQVLDHPQLHRQERARDAVAQIEVPEHLFRPLLVRNDNGDELGDAELVVYRRGRELARTGSLGIVQLDAFNRRLVAAEIDDIGGSSLKGRSPADESEPRSCE